MADRAGQDNRFPGGQPAQGGEVADGGGGDAGAGGEVEALEGGLLVEAGPVQAAADGGVLLGLQRRISGGAFAPALST
jgi:hypothetical protein